MTPAAVGVDTRRMLIALRQIALKLFKAAGQARGFAFFRCVVLVGQLIAQLPDLKHLCVLEGMARAALNPLLEGLALVRCTGFVLQAQASVRRLIEDFIVGVLRALEVH